MITAKSRSLFSRNSRDFSLPFDAPW
jgi:hypothetical protein